MFKLTGNKKKKDAEKENAPTPQKVQNKNSVKKDGVRQNK